MLQPARPSFLARTEADSAVPCALTRLCLPIGIGQIGTRRRLQRLEIDPRLDEHEAAVVPHLLLLAKEFLATGLQFFGAGLEQMEVGTELEPDDDERWTITDSSTPSRNGRALPTTSSSWYRSSKSKCINNLWANYTNRFESSAIRVCPVVPADL